MSSLAQLSRTLQTVLTTTADQAAQLTGFVQRHSKLTGAKFVQTLVFTWLDQPAATYEQLAQTATALGVPITAQGLEERFTPQAAACLKQVLAAAVQQLVTADPLVLPLLQRFNGVYLQDSTTITLPDELAALWAGCGGRTDQGTQAALKVQLQFNYCSGQVTQLDLQAGRSQDKRAPMQTTPLPVGALRLADLGYFAVPVLRDYDQQHVYTVSRYHPQVLLFTPEGAPLDLASLLVTTPQDQLDLAVTLSHEYAWPCRLVALRVPAPLGEERRRKAKAAARREGRILTARHLALLDWTLIVTNVPASWLSVSALWRVLRLRWQIELMFKLWKSQGQVDAWRSHKPYRILCEVYAKLLVLLLQHWILLTCGWQYANRSLVKAGQTIRRHALALGEALLAPEGVCAVLQTVARCLAKGARLNSRRQAPNAYQLLMAGPEPILA
jgi:hypothetical protein